MGFEAASVNEIVKRSGGSLATLYKLFGTKEELFESLVIARTQSIYESLAFDRLSEFPPTKVLRDIGLTLTQICASPQGAAIFRIVMAEGARFSRLREIFLTNAIDLVQHDLAKYLTRQVKAGTLELEDPLQATKQFLEMVKGDLAIRICCGAQAPSRRALERQVESAVHLFLHGALPR